MESLGVHGVCINLLLFSGIPIFENDSMSLTVRKFRFYFHFVLLGTTVVFFVQNSCSHSLDIRHIRRSFCYHMIDNGAAVRTAKGNIQFMPCLAICNHTRNNESHLFLVITLHGIGCRHCRTTVHICRQSAVLVSIFNDCRQRSCRLIASRQRSPSETLHVDNRQRFRIVGVGCRSISPNQSVFEIDGQRRISVVHRTSRQHTLMIGSRLEVIVSNMCQFGGTLIDIQVSARIDKVNSIIHIRSCCSAAYRLLLREGGSGDNALQVFDRKALEGSNMRSISRHRLKTDVIQSKVIASILETGIEVDDADFYIGTGGGRRCNGRHTVPAIVLVIAQVNC